MRTIKSEYVWILRRLLKFSQCHKLQKRHKVTCSSQYECVWTYLGWLHSVVNVAFSVCTCHCLTFLGVKYGRTQIPGRQSGFEDCSQWLQAVSLCDVFIGAVIRVIFIVHRPGCSKSGYRTSYVWFLDESCAAESQIQIQFKKTLLIPEGKLSEKAVPISVTKPVINRREEPAGSNVWLDHV